MQYKFELEIHRTFHTVSIRRSNDEFPNLSSYKRLRIKPTILFHFVSYDRSRSLRWDLSWRKLSLKMSLINEENPMQMNSKHGRFTTSLVYNQQKPQLLVTLIKQSQLVVTKIVLKLTQRMSQPPNTSRKETNWEKRNVLKHHCQIMSHDWNLTIQKRRKKQPRHQQNVSYFL